MNLNLRYSPSGPFLGDIPGQPFHGLQLRLVEAAFSVAQLPVTAALTSPVGVHGEQFQVELPNPDPQRLYKIQVGLQFSKIISAEGRILLQIEAQWTNDETWLELGGQTYDFPFELMRMDAQQAFANFPATLGADFHQPMPADATHLRVRARVRSDESGIFLIPSPTGLGNQAFISLAELQA